jgi:YegS/Rv2252/BmrU family lipid kinase
MSAAGPYLLLVNPSAGAGRARERLPRVERALGQRGIDFRVLHTEGLEHGCAEARTAAAEGVTPVVMSGDGLIGQVGGALAGSGIPMGIVPGGRGNDLARVLGIPTDVEGAVGVLAAAATRAVDVGEVNGKPFLGIASCGFDSECNGLANETKWIRGNLVYLYSALRTLAGWSPAHFTVVLDGDRREFSGYTVAAANSRAYGGGMFLAPEAELDDGLLDVVFIAEVGKLRFLLNLPKVFKGRHLSNPEVSVMRAAEVELSADRPFAVYADGDQLTDLPARVRLLPQALEVIVPPAGPS